MIIENLLIHIFKCMVYGCKCVLWLATAISKRDVEIRGRFCSATPVGESPRAWYVPLRPYISISSLSFLRLLVFLDKYCTLHCPKLANMENLSTCDQNCLTTGDLISSELGDSTC